MQAADCCDCALTVCSCRISFDRSDWLCMAALRRSSRLHIIASPASCTIARLSEVLPSRAAAAPITPSLPIMAASTSSPVDRDTTIEMTALVGK